MTNLTFSLALLAIAYFAGFIGALTGLGGGVILVPALVILFHIDLKFAMGASLIAVIATSSGAALTFMQHNFTNMKIGMFLEIGAVVGAIVGALMVKFIPTPFISIIFGIVLLFSIWFTITRHEEIDNITPSHPWAQYLSLGGTYPTAQGVQSTQAQEESKTYPVLRVPLGFSLMTLAGILSGLLGIGSGALKVLSLDVAMGLPYKISTSTSNFMIGMTAAAGAGIYLSSGYIIPEFAFPVVLGVLLGAFMGSKLLIHAHPKRLRLLFVVIIFLLAIQMIYNGFVRL